MKTPTKSFLSLAACALLAVPALRADILDLQFGATGSNTQAGFDQFFPAGQAQNGSGTMTYASAGVTSGLIGVTIDSNGGPAINRDGQSNYTGPYLNLYTAFVGAAPNIGLTLTGLNPLKTYMLTIQSTDIFGQIGNSYSTGTWTPVDTTVGGTDLTSTTGSYNDAFDPTQNLGPNAGETPSVLQFVANASGNATFNLDPNGDIRMNGLEITAVYTPEPSTYALLGCGLVGLLVLARRRRA